MRIGKFRTGSVWPIAHQPHAALPLLCALLIGACVEPPPPEPPTQEEIWIAQIEAAVALPEGASSIDKYSRNYALRPDGKIQAVYLRPRPATWDEDAGDGCSVMLADFESRPCTNEEIAEIRQSEEATAEAFGEADQSRWFDDPYEIPSVDGGGCSFIEIVFDPRLRNFEFVQCNDEI